MGRWLNPEVLEARAATACAGGAMSSTFLTSTAAEEADQSAQAMRTLAQELDLLRGVGGLGMPALDHEVEVASTARANGPSYDPPQLLHSSSAPQLAHEPELPSAVDELDSAQLRLVEELERQRVRRDWEGRAGLQEALRRQEDEARGQRDALLGYLDELRRRDDEAGSEIRGDGFGRRVDELAAEELCRRRYRGDIGEIAGRYRGDISVASPPNQEVSRRGVAGAQQGFARLAAITDDPNPNPNPNPSPNPNPNPIPNPNPHPGAAPRRPFRGEGGSGGAGG